MRKKLTYNQHSVWRTNENPPSLVIWILFSHTCNVPTSVKIFNKIRWSYVSVTLNFQSHCSCIFFTMTFISLLPDCESLYLTPSVSGGMISDDYWARHWYECSRMALGVIIFLHSFSRMVVSDLPLLMWAV